MTRISDVSGPYGRAGTRYTTWFGRMQGPSEIIHAERPRFVKTRFGSGLLRGITQVTFELETGGTRLVQELWTEGIIGALAARIFATGSYRGSFRGELNTFVRLAERDAMPAEATRRVVE